MASRPSRSLLLALAAALMGGPASPALAQRPAASVDSAWPQATGRITLSNGVLQRDGRPWQIKGVKLVGRLVPPRELNSPIIGENLRAAHDAWTPRLPAQIRAFGADSVSISVSQPGLDPQHPIYDPAYRTQVVDAIRMFRREGFTVLVSMQWERGAGSADEPGWPTDSSARAWQALLGALPRSDTGILFDLFNEPTGDGTPQNWARWQDGNQLLIDTVRRAGFRDQIVIASGLRAAKWLDGAPRLSDPSGKLIYGVHPGLGARKLGFEDPANWDRYYGNFCRRHTCITTEWTMNRRLENRFQRSTACAGDAPELVQTLFRYLWDRRMGMTGWSFDYPDTMLWSIDPLVPTNFDAWRGSCEASTEKYGAGQAVMDWFHRH